MVATVNGKYIPASALPVRPTRQQGSGRTFEVKTPLGAILKSLGWRINKLALVTDINQETISLYVRGRKRIASHHIGILAETLGVQPQDIDYIPAPADEQRRNDYDSVVSEIWNILVELHDPQVALDFGVENSNTAQRPCMKSTVRLLYTLLLQWEQGSIPGTFSTSLGSLRETFVQLLAADGR